MNKLTIGSQLIGHKLSASDDKDKILSIFFKDFDTSELIDCLIADDLFAESCLLLADDELTPADDDYPGLVFLERDEVIGSVGLVLEKVSLNLGKFLRLADGDEVACAIGSDHEYVVTNNLKLFYDVFLFTECGELLIDFLVAIVCTLAGETELDRG
jgi:hypothetical protein